MPHFVAHDEGQFLLAVGDRQQATRHIDVAARHGEGVDHVAVHEGEGALSSNAGRRGDPVADVRDESLGLPLVRPAELLDDLRMFPSRLLAIGLGNLGEGGRREQGCGRGERTDPGFA